MWQPNIKKFLSLIKLRVIFLM